MQFGLAANQENSRLIFGNLLRKICMVTEVQQVFVGNTTARFLEMNSNVSFAMRDVLPPRHLLKRRIFTHTSINYDFH